MDKPETFYLSFRHGCNSMISFLKFSAMNNKSVTRNFLSKALIILSVLVTTLSLSAQSLHPLEPIQGNYKKLASKSAAQNPQRADLDTLRFPWSEYSSGALTNTLLRMVYLSKENEAKLPGLVKFPANSSNQTRAELDYLLTLQNSRTPEQIARAEYIANIGSWPNILNPYSDYNTNKKQLFYLASDLGEEYNYQNFPATTQLLLNCIQDIRATEFRLKYHFRRARPYHLEPALKPLARMSSPSFASGHTLWAFTEAYIFSEIIPEKRDLFLKKAEEVRWSRELMGIHYPSDNEASRVLGRYLLKYWQENPQFREDLKNAKQEWEEKKNIYAKSK